MFLYHFCIIISPLIHMSRILTVKPGLMTKKVANSNWPISTKFPDNFFMVPLVQYTTNNPMNYPIYFQNIFNLSYGFFKKLNYLNWPIPFCIKRSQYTLFLLTNQA